MKFVYVIYTQLPGEMPKPTDWIYADKAAADARAALTNESPAGQYCICYVEAIALR